MKSHIIKQRFPNLQDVIKRHVVLQIHGQENPKFKVTAPKSKITEPKFHAHAPLPLMGSPHTQFG